MKKGLCIILSIAMLLISLVACGKKDDDTNQTTKLNSSGDAYINITNKDGEDVTDEDGNAVTSVLSDKEKSKLDKTNKADSTSSTKGTAATVPSGLDDIMNVEDFNPVAKPEDLLDEGTTVPKKTTLREDVIGNSFQKQKYTLSMTIVGEDGEVPATIAMNGSDFALSVDWQGLPVKMIIKDGKTYIAFEYGAKFYMETEEIIDSAEMTPNSEKHTYVGTSNVKEGDKTYICEEYKTESGTTVKYYFLDKKWVRYEAIDGDQVAIFKVNDFKSSVDKSLFDLKGYTKFDVNAFANMGA
ncbi:MAG: hypothetical protein IJ447_04740 [Clostridia bacterium]|nr:hypothetical protein [Clostridia bacterium]